MEASYVIRVARERDLPFLPEIELAAATLLADHAPPSVLNETTEPVRFSAAQAEGRLWVALAEGLPVGFAHVTLVGGEEAHLEEIDVLPQHGRRGLGARLVSAACDGAASLGCRELTLTTFRDVPFNMPFYARLRFEEVPAAELSPMLRAIVADETRRGLDPARRVVMRRRLGFTGLVGDTSTARRVERSEAAAMRDTVAALVGSERAPGAFVRELGSGIATYVRAGSPLNKVIGAGIEAPVDEALLGDIERAFHARGEPVRAEITTLAVPETWEQLGARGYRLLGFENALARPLDRVVTRNGGAIRVEPATAATSAAFRETLVLAASHSDETGVPLDHLSREEIATAIDDSLIAADFRRYLAYRDGVLAGAASMHLEGDVAVLTGSATLPEHRRRGVQAALLARRLDDARGLGASLAVITTAPGTQSQANVMKLGFSLVYARAVLLLPPG